jgi:hypothetical protein
MHIILHSTRTPERASAQVSEENCVDCLAIGVRRSEQNRAIPEHPTIPTCADVARWLLRELRGAPQARRFRQLSRWKPYREVISVNGDLAAWGGNRRQRQDLRHLREKFLRIPPPLNATDDRT